MTGGEYYVLVCMADSLLRLRYTVGSRYLPYFPIQPSLYYHLALFVDLECDVAAYIATHRRD